MSTWAKAGDASARRPAATAAPTLEPEDLQIDAVVFAKVMSSRAPRDPVPILAGERNLV